MKHFENLKKSEIKKAEKLANKLNNCKDCTVSAWASSRIPDEIDFIRVWCEITHSYNERAEYDVELEIFLPDRRRSWAHEVLPRR